MELKKEETPKREENTFIEINSVNDALFGNVNMDTPYQSSNYNSTNFSSKKSDGSDIVKYVIIAIIVIFVAGGFLTYNKKIKERNGTYELVSVSRYGTTYSVEELETISGMDIFASITINGSECDIKIDYTYIRMEDVGEIKFSGSKVTISDCSDTMKGTYNSSSKTISLESDGAELNFKKID